MGKPKTISLLLLVSILALLTHFQLENNASIPEASENAEWVYYGFSPRVNYTLAAADQTLNNATWLSVVGYNDSTHVTVYDITGEGSRVLDSFTVNRMETYRLQLPKKGNYSIETFFKVVSDKPIAVLMHGGINYIEENQETWGTNLFYPSTDGGFAGKEFIFLSAQSAALVRRKGEDYVVFGVEDSDVVVQDAKGNVVITKHVAANSSIRLPLYPGKVYRVVSSGRIMVSTWSMLSLTVIPSPLGGYVQKLFFAKPDQTETEGSPVLVILAQEKPSHVQVIDTSTGSKIIDKEVASRELWLLKREESDLEGKSIMIKSSAPIVAFAGSTFTGRMGTSGTLANLANAVFFVGVKPNEPTTFYVPSRGIIFSPKSNAEVKVNRITFTIPKGSYKDIPVGQVTLISNATLIVEVTVSYTHLTLPTN